MIRARYRHILRFREIGKILTKHGLGQLVDILTRGETSFFKRNKEDYTVLTYAERFRTALEELGPTFVKLGQLLSTRPDLLPPVLIMEMEKLQDKVHPISFEQIKTVLEVELGTNYHNVFSYIDEKPLAAASIGQVHRGKLASGEDVVLKIQRPGVDRIVETDLEILLDSARVLQAKTKWGAFYQGRRKPTALAVG
jgi:ubiquinone biosynthesis protein